MDSFCWCIHALLYLVQQIQYRQALNLSTEKKTILLLSMSMFWKHSNNTINKTDNKMNCNIISVHLMFFFVFSVFKLLQINVLFFPCLAKQSLAQHGKYKKNKCDNGMFLKVAYMKLIRYIGPSSMNQFVSVCAINKT